MTNDLPENFRILAFCFEIQTSYFNKCCRSACSGAVQVNSVSFMSLLTLKFVGFTVFKAHLTIKVIQCNIVYFFVQLVRKHDCLPCILLTNDQTNLWTMDYYMKGGPKVCYCPNN